MRALTSTEKHAIFLLKFKTASLLHFLAFSLRMSPPLS